MLLFEKLYMLANLTTLMICLALLLYSWLRRSTAGGRAATAMMGSVCFWLFTNLVGWLSEDPAIQFLWYRIGYLGVLTLPLGWLSFALVLSGVEAWLTLRRILLMLLVPLLLFILVLSGAFYHSVEFVVIDGVTIRQVQFTAWALVAEAYTYGVLLIGSILLVRFARRAPPLLRYQAAAMIATPLLPLAANFGYMTGTIPLYYDLTPISFAFSSMVLFWGLYRFRLFDLVPVARSAMVDRVTDGMLVVDALGRLADLNPAAAILCAPVQHLIGQHLADVLPQMAEILAGAPAHPVEITLQAGAQPCTYEVMITPLFAQEKWLAGNLLLFHDVSVRKLVENGLQAALDREREINEIKSRFYSYFSHQLRTPLSVVMSSAEILDHYGRSWPEEKRQRHFQRIYQSVERLLYLSNNASVFEMSEQGFPPLAPDAFDVQALARQWVEEFQAADPQQHVLQFEGPGVPVEAYQDSALLRQVLENLLSNACKFSPHGSLVRVELATTPGRLRFTITDQGCGIPPDELPRVTQPFFRASNVSTIPGTGLGLAIVEQYIHRLQGELTLESHEKLGTSAVVTLPLQWSDA